MFAIPKSLICLFIIILSHCGAINYCGSNYCNNSKQHTLCKFQSTDPARHCLDYEKTLRSVKEKQAILDKLNSRRNKVAGGEIRSLPASGNMMKLEWNEELELSAQRWADQCLKHRTPDIKDTCRDLGPVFVEQNIASIYGEAPGLTPLALVDVWYMELLNINASVLLRYQRSKNMVYSHYDYFTQLMWANSKQVGCGGVKFKERLGEFGSDKKRAVYRLVCNFAPGGNVDNQSVYDQGPPCSKCPSGACDSVYTSLCNSKPTTTKTTERTEFNPTTNIFLKGLKRTEKNTITSHYSTESSTHFENDDDNVTPFDYFPHMHDYVRPTLATTTKATSSCKDNILAVDDFVELLKRKLSTDPMFKDLLQSTTTQLDNANNGYTDALAMLGKIYSKSMPSTTAKPPGGDFLNSTLLVDLVEAVIFRNSIPGKVKYSQDTVTSTLPEPNYVSPVKIQAELAEIRGNSDLAGHLFFPEDMEDGDENSETTEHYYDMTYPSISEFEIQDIRRSKSTKDFLEDILDSETVTENADDFNTIITRRPLRKYREKRENTQENDNYLENAEYIESGYPELPEKYKKSIHSDCKHIVMKYSELLIKLASDIKVLKLQERFHCAGSFAKKYSHCTTLTWFVIILEVSFYLIKLLQN